MRAKFFIVFIGTVIAFSMTAKGQFDFAEPSKKVVPAHLRSVKQNISKPAYYNNISMRAVRDFMTKFAEISNETWFCTADLFVATFTLDDIFYRVDYDKYGNWIETCRTYDKSKLPFNVRQAVKGSYHDCSILLVQEIKHTHQSTVYVIHLTGKKKMINLQVVDGAVCETKKFKKSKH